jgi:putative restriction endonuclease
MQSWIAIIPDATDDGVPPGALTSYTYESHARSQRQIESGDIFFLRNQSHLCAIARVEHVAVEQQEKAATCCPVCGIAKMEFRKKRPIPYRCFHGHQFLTPSKTTRAVAVFTIGFAADYIRVHACIEAAELRPFELTNGGQLKLRPSEHTGIVRYVARRDHTVAAQLKIWLKDRSIALDDGDADVAAGAALLIVDEQERPFQAIRVRRGETHFRDKLINRYGPHCMVSGCSILALLEACHVSRYHGPSDNHPANGLLLRSDLHTLFDLDLIGFNPEGFQMAIHPRLLGSEYEKLAGTRLSIATNKGPDMRAVRSRWESFVQKANITSKQAILMAVNLNIVFQLMFA